MVIGSGELSGERCSLKSVSYDQIVQVLRLLAHPARLRILDELRKGDACVCHLEMLLRHPQPYVSQQLRVLREAGVIESYKEGLFVYYRLVSPQVARLLDTVLGPPPTAIALPGCTCPRCANAMRDA